jgi:chromosome partitioning protein
MRKIAVINQKGGVGKTTTTANLGAALALRGKKVLLLDMDPQANLTLHLDHRPGADDKTMTSVLVDDAKLSEAIAKTRMEGLWLLPTDTSLAGVEQVLANRIGRETILREAFGAWSDADFDFALMDCPPSLGVLSANALVAADEVLIPIQTEYFALQGMAKLLEVVQLVRKRLNPELEICAILPCMVDLRTNLTAEVIAEIQRHFGQWVSKSMIRSNVKLAEAPSFGRTIFEHAPESNGADDYAAFAAELLGEAAALDPMPAPPQEPDANSAPDRATMPPAPLSAPFGAAAEQAG